MKIALRPQIPTYSGGLGVLVGDILRSAADLDLPLVGITLVSRAGYLRQEIDFRGRQIEHSHPGDSSERASLHDTASLLQRQIGLDLRNAGVEK